MTVSAKFKLASDSLGLGRLENNANPPGCIDVVNILLTKNHTRWHMYFREVAGHNHIPHAILSVLAMGGSPQDLRRAYDDGEDIQRPMPALDHLAIKEMSDPTNFRKYMQTLDQYPNFLAFFEEEIAAKGPEAVINEYCFSRTPLADLMLAQLFEGLYHPIIHLGFGIEFGLPSLVAEGLAQTASHDPMYIDAFFRCVEAKVQAPATTPTPRPLVELYRQVRANETIRTAARLPDGPWKVRDGVLGRAFEEIVAVAAQFQVVPLGETATQAAAERATAEMISCAAWTCGAAHKPGHERKIDFFLMHNVTSSLFLTVLIRQPWLALSDKVRLVEWKTRLDLVWYAASAAPELRDENITGYEATLSRDMGWEELYQALNKHHDDGHVAKLVRALKNGEDATRPYEEATGDDNDVASALFPVKGDLWLKIAQMCYDSTVLYVDGQKKWVWGAGFDKMWECVPEFLRET